MHVCSAVQVADCSIIDTEPEGVSVRLAIAFCLVTVALLPVTHLSEYLKMFRFNSRANA
jgi:hypothetical protein